MKQKEENKTTYCYYDGNRFSEGSTDCHDGILEICRDGEWESTGDTC